MKVQNPKIRIFENSIWRQTQIEVRKSIKVEKDSERSAMSYIVVLLNFSSLWLKHVIQDLYMFALLPVIRMFLLYILLLLLLLNQRARIELDSNRIELDSCCEKSNPMNHDVFHYYLVYFTIMFLIATWILASWDFS